MICYHSDCLSVNVGIKSCESSYKSHIGCNYCWLTREKLAVVNEAVDKWQGNLPSLILVRRCDLSLLDLSSGEGELSGDSPSHQIL